MNLSSIEEGIARCHNEVGLTQAMLFVRGCLRADMVRTVLRRKPFQIGAASDCGHRCFVRPVFFLGVFAPLAVLPVFEADGDRVAFAAFGANGLSRFQSERNIGSKYCAISGLSM